MTQAKDDPAPRSKRRSTKLLHELILDAAREEFERNGFSGATTAAIARRAAVTEAQLFRLFASKQALFRAAIFEPLTHHLAAFMAAYPARTPTERQRAATCYVDELQDFFDRHSRMMMSLMVASIHGAATADDLADMSSLARYFDQGAGRLAGRLEEGSPIDPQLMVRVSFAAVLGASIFHEWLFPPGLASPERIRDAITNFVVDGIGIGAIAPASTPPPMAEPPG